MSTDIRVALIAGLVSLAVTIIGVLSSLIIQKLQSLDSEKQIRASISEKLMTLRLENYPRAFDITDRIQRRSEPQRIISRQELLEIRKQLLEWKSGVVSLILSPKSIESFYELRNALKMGYSEKDSFSHEQVEKIISIKNDFRKSLRSDIGFLHVKSPQLEKQ